MLQGPVGDQQAKRWLHPRPEAMASGVSRPTATWLVATTFVLAAALLSHRLANQAMLPLTLFLPHLAETPQEGSEATYEN